MSARHRRRRRRAAPRRTFRRWYRRQDRLTRGLLLAVVVLGALVAALMVPLRDRDRAGLRADRSAGAPPATRLVPSPRASATAKPAARPRREARATAPAMTRRTASPSRPERAEEAPRAAIVIDDLGQRLAHLEQLAAIGIPLTIAVIPGLPATAATVREASRLGIEMILHQPMEPREEGGKSPGAGVLLTSMSAAEVRARLGEGLAAVPGAVGVNNHMGSRFTEEPAGLDAVMAELKARGLFWLDSRTTAATRGAEIARGAAVPTLERDVFLDAEAGTEFVRGQVRRLVTAARHRGTAIGIGHPHPDTVAVLREMREELLGSGVMLVPLSALVPAGGAAGTSIAAAPRPGKGRAGSPAAAASP